MSKVINWLGAVCLAFAFLAAISTRWTLFAILMIGTLVFITLEGSLRRMDSKSAWKEANKKEGPPA